MNVFWYTICVYRCTREWEEAGIVGSECGGERVAGNGDGNGGEIEW